MNKSVIVLGLLAWMLFYGAGEYLSKLWSQRPSPLLTILIVSSYSIGALFWLPALRAHGGLAVLTTIFSVAGTLAGVLIGLLIFKEVVTIQHLVGIGLALVSIVLLC